MRNNKVTPIVLVISIILNLSLGFSLYKMSQGETPQKTQAPVSVEEASGINSFETNQECNTVFGYKVCTSDFVGLYLPDARRKAQMHGLSYSIRLKEGSKPNLYLTSEPFRVNFDLDKDNVVTAAVFR